MDAAHAVIRHATAIHVLPLQAALGPGLPGSVIKIQELEDGRDEAAWVAQRIADLLRDGRAPREVAVLFRTRQKVMRTFWWSSANLWVSLNSCAYRYTWRAFSDAESTL